MAERAVLNELAFNQYATGDFGHRVYSDTGLPAAGAVRAWWCCTLHGLRCFPDIQTSVFRAQNDGIYYDLSFDGRIETPTLSAVAESTLAENGSVKITITAAGDAPATLHIRKPDWAERVDVQLKGPRLVAPAENGYVGIERVWTAGDVVEVKYAMKLRSEQTGKERVVYFFGPWLLGAPASDNFAYFNELTPDNKIAVSSARELSASEQPARPFGVPIAARAFRCTPAEFANQPGTVVLRAIAEQAGQPTTSWELRFLTERS
jgi:DUF1680 family protein